MATFTVADLQRLPVASTEGQAGSPPAQFTDAPLDLQFTRRLGDRQPPQAAVSQVLVDDAIFRHQRKAIESGFDDRHADTVGGERRLTARDGQGVIPGRQPLHQGRRLHHRNPQATIALPVKVGAQLEPVGGRHVDRHEVLAGQMEVEVIHVILAMKLPLDGLPQPERIGILRPIVGLHLPTGGELSQGQGLEPIVAILPFHAHLVTPRQQPDRAQAAPVQGIAPPGPLAVEEGAPFAGNIERQAVDGLPLGTDLPGLGITADIQFEPADLAGLETPQAGLFGVQHGGPVTMVIGHGYPAGAVGQCRLDQPHLGGHRRLGAP